MIARSCVAVLVLVSVIMFGMVAASPTGSPANCCEEMVPGHGVDAQPGQSNYKTVPSATSISASGSVDLTISSTRGDTFRGYLVVANKLASNEIVGAFTNGGTGQILDCVLGTGAPLRRAGATHVENGDKSTVTVTWTPDGFIGSVEFKTTYVQNSTIFWVKESSVVVTVTP